MGIPESPEWRIGVALAIGLLMGAEREKRKGEGPDRGAAGVRTFAVTGLLGGVAAQLGVAATVVLGALVGAGALTAYVLGDRTDPGLTTELALLLDYALGALARDRPELAFGIAVTATAVLAFRARIHEIVREVISETELLDLLMFGVVAVAVWSFLPDRAIDRYGVVNPFILGRLVVLVMAVTGAGYIAQRVVGPRFGLAIAGFASGFVSSTATIHAMGQTARADAAARPAATAGATASSVPTFVLAALLVGTASPRLLGALAVPMAVGGGVALLYAAIMTLRAARAETPELGKRRAFRLRTAVLFALIVAAVMFGAALLEEALGQRGAVVAAAVAAFADAHAASASVAALEAGQKLATPLAALGVLIALSTNAVTKVVMAFTGGPRRFAVQVALGQVLAIGAAWAALLMT